jgi:hypothetical protein
MNFLGPFIAGVAAKIVADLLSPKVSPTLSKWASRTVEAISSFFPTVLRWRLRITEKKLNAVRDHSSDLKMRAEKAVIDSIRIIRIMLICLSILMVALATEIGRSINSVRIFLDQQQKSPADWQRFHDSTLEVTVVTVVVVMVFFVLSGLVFQPLKEAYRNTFWLNDDNRQRYQSALELKVKFLSLLIDGGSRLAKSDSTSVEEKPAGDSTGVR